MCLKTVILFSITFISLVSAIDDKHVNSRLEPIRTEDDLNYEFRPITDGIIRFELKARVDAWLTLSSSNDRINPIIEIRIGNLNNTITSLTLNQDFLNPISYNTPNILSPDEYRPFYVKWSTKNNVTDIVLGISEGITLSWVNPEPFQIEYFGVIASHQGEFAMWKIEQSQCEPLELITQGVSSLTLYNFYPISSGRVSLMLQAAHDAHIALASSDSEPLTEIILGAENNSQSIIGYNNESPDKVRELTEDILSPNAFKIFDIVWHGGNVEVLNPNHLMSWKNPNHNHFKVIGLSTRYGADGNWLISEATTSVHGKYIFTPREGRYVHHVIPDNSKLINFQVKSENNARFKLMNANHKGIEIRIGVEDNNARSFITNSEYEYYVYAETPEILNKNEFRSFWVRWSDNYVTIGKQGDYHHFLAWEYPGLPDFGYFGISTLATDGFWRIGNVCDGEW